MRNVWLKENLGNTQTRVIIYGNILAKENQ